jgi:hypothetical protein
MQSRAAHNWLLRLCALIVFISGGALAQRFVQEIETQLIPLEFPREKHSKAVAFEVRQPEPVQLHSALAPARALAIFSRVAQQITVALVEQALGLTEPRAFDALAPPQK